MCCWLISLIFSAMLARQCSTAGDDGTDGKWETCLSVCNGWTLLHWQWCNDCSHWCWDVSQWACYSMAKHFLYSEVIISRISGRCFQLFVPCVRRGTGQWISTEILSSIPSLSFPLPSNRQYLSYDACLEVKREDNQNCSVLCCVRQLCTMISTLSWAVLTVLWIGFCNTGSILLCVDLFVFVYIRSCLINLGQKKYWSETTPSPQYLSSYCQCPFFGPPCI